MSKFKAAILILFMAVVFSHQAYGLESKTVTGKVISTDVEGAAVTVDTSTGTMTFYLLAESELSAGAHHLASIQIGKNDPVTIEYNNVAGKNNIIKLVDNNPSL